RAEAFIELITMLVLAQEPEYLSVLEDSGKNIIQLAIDSIDVLDNGETKAKLSIDLLGVLTQLERTEKLADIDKQITDLVDSSYIIVAVMVDSEDQVRIFSYLTICLARAGFSQIIKQYGLLAKIQSEINNAVQKVDMSKLTQLREELTPYFLDALYSLVYYWQLEGEEAGLQVSGEKANKEQMLMFRQNNTLNELRVVLQKIVVEMTRLNRSAPVKTVDIPDEFIAALWRVSTIKEPAYIQDSLRVLAGRIVLIGKLTAQSKYFKELIDYIEEFQDKLDLGKGGLTGYLERMNVEKYVLTEKKIKPVDIEAQIREMIENKEQLKTELAEMEKTLEQRRKDHAADSDRALVNA
ncbi:MAG: hypothetical protein KAJ14_06410, partial [Candidatus Omnitrophica bacterium]|nr:hypothetical protein [Candidatus Omnitrophota bacterium]